MGQHDFHTEQTIARLPDSEGDTLCYALSGLVTGKDHESFVRDVQETVGRYGSFNILFHYRPSFQGWEKEAADGNLRAILDYGRATRRLAYVNPPEKKIIHHKMAPEMFGGEMRYFEEAQLRDAIAWVKGG